MSNRADNAKGTTRDVNAAQRAVYAVQLRAKRLTYDEIALQCGYSDRGAAHRAVQRELQRVVSENVDDLRREEADSLDRLEAACWKRLEDNEYSKSKLFAVDRILAIKERRAKLFGLDVKPESASATAKVIVRGMPSGYLGEEKA